MPTNIQSSTIFAAGTVKPRRFTAATVLAVLVLLMIGCGTTAARLDSNKDMVSDTGGLTRQELEAAALHLATGIQGHFAASKEEDGVFLAHYPTKNETSEQIPTKFFDTAFVQTLLKHKIYTVAVRDRSKALKEIAFSRTGLTDNQISVGNLKSPNFFVETVIEENAYRSSGDKVVEQTIDVKLIRVDSTVVVWSGRKVYRKRAAGRGGVSF